jgi:uncharacterized protein YbdZ (MbtH family)
MTNAEKEARVEEIRASIKAMLAETFAFLPQAIQTKTGWEVWVGDIQEAVDDYLDDTLTEMDPAYSGKLERPARGDE